MTEASTINVTARLTSRADVPWPGGQRAGRSWYITHTLGGPAAGTFTEVVMPDFTPDGEPLSDATKEAAVRQVAESLYGRAYAFIYRPDQADRSVHAYRLVGREHVIVSAVEVWA
jgi:hypothetical protein